MSEAGRLLPMSLGRRIVGDFLHASMNIPLVSFAKTIDIAEVVAARLNAEPRPSWCSIFTKAYAKAVAARPEMRRACLTFPWQRMFEYATASADVVVEARLPDENVLVSVPLKQPALTPLLEIDRVLTWCKEDPVERVRRFQRALLLARFPRFVRRWAWWYLLNVAAGKRTRYFGSFGVSSVGNWGVESMSPIAPWSTLLHYGAIDPQDKITLRLTFDHRVMDGSSPAKALLEMEHHLKQDILAEVKTLQPRSLSYRFPLTA